MTHRIFVLLNRTTIVFVLLLLFNLPSYSDLEPTPTPTPEPTNTPQIAITPSLSKAENIEALRTQIADAVSKNFVIEEVRPAQCEGLFGIRPVGPNATLNVLEISATSRYRADLTINELFDIYKSASLANTRLVFANDAEGYYVISNSMCPAGSHSRSLYKFYLVDHHTGHIELIAMGGLIKSWLFDESRTALVLNNEFMQGSGPSSYTLYVFDKNKGRWNRSEFAIDPPTISDPEFEFNSAGDRFSVRLTYGENWYPPCRLTYDFRTKYQTVLAWSATEDYRFINGVFELTDRELGDWSVLTLGRNQEKISDWRQYCAER